MQTIIGANGSIGNILAQELTSFTDKIRLVSRNPRKINHDDELFKADALDSDQISDAVKGSEIVYLTVGLPYKIKVWEQQWHIIMDNVIKACIAHNAKLVFFDNVYMYGLVDGKMTEKTAVNPISRKGEVRAKIAAKLMDETKKGNIDALIARSADFYGVTPLSIPYFLVIDKLLNGKKAQWMVDENKIHSFTYVPDAAKATALLGNTDDAYGEVWHLPTDSELITGHKFMKLAAESLNTELKYTILKQWMIKMIGLFNPAINELTEMLYQNKYDYIFDSSKFDNKFEFNKKTYKEGMQEIADTIRK